MARPVTLFTGQWADLPFAELRRRPSSSATTASSCPAGATTSRSTRRSKDKNYASAAGSPRDARPQCFASRNHLVGQAVCDLIDERHKLILPADVWGDGEPEGVRKRAAQKMIDTAKAAGVHRRRAEKIGFPAVVNGFTGSSIWHSIYAFPPTDQKYWQKGFDDFAKRWTPILDEFDKMDVNFALEVHPTEIAFDIASAQRAIDAVEGAQAFGFNYDPSPPRLPGRRLRRSSSARSATASSTST